MLVIRGGTHKLLVKKANRADTVCLGVCARQLQNVLFKILEHFSHIYTDKVQAIGGLTGFSMGLNIKQFHFNMYIHITFFSHISLDMFCSILVHTIKHTREPSTRVVQSLRGGCS